MVGLLWGTEFFVGGCACFLSHFGLEVECGDQAGDHLRAAGLPQVIEIDKASLTFQELSVQLLLQA